MGGEIAQEREWSQDRSLDWHLLDDPGHRGILDLIREVNKVAAGELALWSRDFDPDGFRWISADDATHSIYAFQRRAAAGDPGVVVVANLTPVPRHGYRLGLPTPGRWVDLLNTDDERFGGSGVVQPEVQTDDIEWQGFPQSAVLTLPPLGVRWLRPG
jgi:1,4-alpha-glucan branching enzyme